MQVSIKGLNLAYEEAGSGPAVILIHGFPLNRQMWAPQLEGLAAAGYRSIAPDLRGFGESEGSEGGYSMDTFADDIVALMDHLGIEQAAVVGMSMGGYVLLNLLERHSKKVAAACFLVTRAGADDDVGKAKRTALAEQVRGGEPWVVAEAFEEVLFAPETPKERPELVQQVKGWMEGTNPLGLAGGLEAMRDRKDYAPSLTQLDLPALVIGAEEDRAIPVEQARFLESGLPKAQACYIPGGGHMVNLERPEAVNDCLIKFLRQQKGRF